MSNGKSKSKYFSLFILACCFLACRAEARSNEAIRSFNEGVKFFNGRQFNEAATYFGKAIAADPNFAEAYFARGACRHSMKYGDAALTDLSEALRLKPDLLDARAMRGVIYYESQRWDQAVEDFNAVLKQNPSDAQSLLGRAVIRLKREDFAGAMRDFRGFLRVRPQDPMAPRIRQLLATLGKVPGGEEETAEAPGHPSGPPRSTPRATARPPSREEIQKLADLLMAHTLTESYSRKVIRGEKAQAVGDLRSESDASRRTRKKQTSEVQIVEP